MPSERGRDAWPGYETPYPSPDMGADTLLLLMPTHKHQSPVKSAEVERLRKAQRVGDQGGEGRGLEGTADHGHLLQQTQSRPPRSPLASSHDRFLPVLRESARRGSG